MDNYALLFGLLACLVSGVGVLAIAMFGARVQAFSQPLSLAASGLLLTLVAFHIAPEALAHNQYALLLMAGGFALGFGLQSGLNAFSRPVGQRAEPALVGGYGASDAVPGGLRLPVLAPLLAIAVHSLLDGAIYGVAFADSFDTGVYAAVALILHELPEAFVAFAIAISAGLSVRQSAFAVILAAGVTTPLGAGIMGPILASSGEGVLPVLMALSAGLLIYVATGPLLEPLRAGTMTMRQSAMPTLAGVAIAVAMLLSPISRSHGVDGHHGPVHAHGHHDHASHDGHIHPARAPFR